MCAEDPIPPTVAWRRGRVRLVDQRALPASGVAHALEGFDRDGAEGALASARALAAADVAANRSLGAHGAALVGDGARILTHCNAGSLACSGYGTALGVVRAAHDSGKSVHVWVSETRPVLQGARLTAWELDRLEIDHTVIADGAGGSLMAGGEVDLVIVGADRVAANGDVANKVGTYPLAVLARAHRLPFYVAAPTTTLDPCTPDGDAIPVEQRDPAEVLTAMGRRTAPVGSTARNPAFDVTPARLGSAIVTERGVCRRPYERSLARVARA